MKIMNFSAANCKSCYKCLRSCPVKAIKFENDQAEIIEDRCIACSHCLLICPQNARKVISDLSDVKMAIASGKRVVASLAPSFAGNFNMETGIFVSVLKKLGFSLVEETAVGAELITDYYSNYLRGKSGGVYITTACPSVNYLVEKYYPALVDYLIPVVSPMIAHGKLIKKHYGEDSYVVFIGPCMAKKTESKSFFNNNFIDAVLNFDEIQSWIDESNINVPTLEASDFDRNPSGYGRYYPNFGGIIKSLEAEGENLNLKKITVSGSDECMDIFKSIENGDIDDIFVEASSCKGSCTGGPDMVKSSHNYYKKLKKVTDYLTNRNAKIVNNIAAKPDKINLERTFVDKNFKKNKAYDHDIQKILQNMGKHNLEDELNCGVCGYNTCREKAQAVFEGMAEPNMCLHYMRTKAESLTNVIFEHTANCIMFLDGNMNIIELNPACEEIFSVNASSIRSLPVSILMDDKDFRKVKETGESIIGKKVSYPAYNAIFIQSIVFLQKQNMIMVSMVNINEQEENRKKFNMLRENTLNSTKEVIDKQMRVAHEIASLLGETTAETKILLTQLKKFVETEDGD